MGTEHKEMIKNAKRIVVKVGTSTLTYGTGKLNLVQIEKLVRGLVDLRYQGKEVVLVSSGAVGAGLGRMNWDKKPKNIPEKQAIAAIGQGILMHVYEKMMSEYGQITAQLLLTKADMDHRGRFLNARNTLLNLLRLDVIPIVNENDTVAFDELRFGDNDRLAALVGVLIDADLVVLLTDIDGLYTANPRTNPEAELIRVVPEITEAVTACAGQAGTNFGTGGMVTKIEAAKIAVNAGIPLVVASGSEDWVVNRMMAGEALGTLFLPKGLKPHSRKAWIAFGSHVSGELIIDDGARKALVEGGKSLLPSGIVAVEGHFSEGDVVSIIDGQGRECARGMTNYGFHDIKQIMGKKSHEIADILGYKDYDEVIHRDNMGLRI